MATITEDYVSFETAKLLKEKGFDWECISYYVDDEPDDVKYSFCGETNSDWESRCCSAPTIQMAMKWLRLIYHIHIRLVNSTDESYRYEIYPRKGKYTGYCFGDKSYYETYEEACEIALKYCLENLI